VLFIRWVLLIRHCKREQPQKSARFPDSVANCITSSRAFHGSGTAPAEPVWPRYDPNKDLIFDFHPDGENACVC
jgi:hypothetical protein